MRKTDRTVNGREPRSRRPFERGYTAPESDDGHETDGRILRGELTRQRIAEAMIDLIESGNHCPTSQEIADRAGVSLRLIFHHYADMEAIFETAGLIQARRHWQKLGTVPPAGPLAGRVTATVQQRRKLYTAIGPVREAVLVRAPGNQAVLELLSAGRRRLRTELETTFEPELATTNGGTKTLIDAMDLVTSWDAWHALRSNGASAASAQRTMAYCLTTVVLGADG
jgi:AcrR family transcriptional regulator